MNPKLRTFYVILSVGCILTAMCLFPWAGDATARLLWSFAGVVFAVVAVSDA